MAADAALPRSVDGLREECPIDVDGLFGPVGQLEGRAFLAVAGEAALDLFLLVGADRGEKGEDEQGAEKKSLSTGDHARLRSARCPAGEEEAMRQSD